MTVHVPMGATFAHSTNGKIVLEFEGVCDKLLDIDHKEPGESTMTRWTETVYNQIYGKQYPANVLLRRSRRRFLDLTNRKKLREIGMRYTVEHLDVKEELITLAESQSRKEKRIYESDMTDSEDGEFELNKESLFTSPHQLAVKQELVEVKIESPESPTS